MTNESQQPNINPQNDEVSLKNLILVSIEWLRYLISRWLIILSIGIAGGVLGFTYAYFKKPVYTATTTFVLEEEKNSGGLSNLAGIASMAGVDLGGSGGGIFQGDNILGLYKSRTMIEQTLLTPIEYDSKKELLVDRYIEFKKLKDQWKGNSELFKLNFSIGVTSNSANLSKEGRLRDSILGVIVQDINKNLLSVVKPDKKLSTIQVDVKATDELFAKAFNDELVTNVNDFYITTKTKKTQKNIEILQHKTDSVRNVMNGAIYRSVEISDATPNLNPTKQIQRVAPTQKAQFSAETNKAILSEMVKNLEMTKLGLLKETPLVQIIDKPIYPLQKEQLGKSKGIVLGGFLFGFMAIMSLIVKRTFIRILK
ncbi:Wzz/FepE/Etk N-terminal domain-containing protein [Pedobacter alluvionis]|uniref:Lipopolysaccharide biosynthesis protein n=1 Tax=Pedobacter alluvionis TaxID=475253 RepID=A0A497Y1L5_9SPHI|nr:Wzz/FepE/Etk N-terminal domain-containing protein [Pedobacter alluvionis]RLJ73890.1 subunit length determinant protein [Pedobacter alluvionis]TFB32503.1 lipopolysaccharide biosynthesis protein [Pedobacter alluvionis]